jgi:hypothetical protein
MELTTHTQFCCDQQADFVTDSRAKSNGDKVSRRSLGINTPNKDALIDSDDLTGPKGVSKWRRIFTLETPFFWKREILFNNSLE